MAKNLLILALLFIYGSNAYAQDDNIKHTDSVDVWKITINLILVPEGADLKNDGVTLSKRTYYLNDEWVLRAESNQPHSQSSDGVISVSQVNPTYLINRLTQNVYTFYKDSSDFVFAVLDSLKYHFNETIYKTEYNKTPLASEKINIKTQSKNSLSFYQNLYGRQHSVSIKETADTNLYTCWTSIEPLPFKSPIDFFYGSKINNLIGAFFPSNEKGGSAMCFILENYSKAKLPKNLFLEPENLISIKQTKGYNQLLPLIYNPITLK